MPLCHPEQELIILGSGPAGLCAALFAARAQLAPLLITGNTPGGQLTRSPLVKNWPGISAIDGTTLCTQLLHHAQEYPLSIVEQTVASVDLSAPLKTIMLADGQTHTTRALIITCGTAPRTLHCPGARELWGRGIFTTLEFSCTSTAEKPLLIVGGGNSAISFAHELLRQGHHVIIAQNMPVLTATDPRRDEVAQKALIYSNTTVHSVQAHGGAITSATIYNASLDTTQVRPVSAIIVATGSQPNTALFEGQLALEESGHIKVEPGSTLTSVPGVFAAGDVADRNYRHAITSAGQGAMAALDAERYLNGRVVVRFY